MSQRPAADAIALDRNLFKAYDIRGIVGRNLIEPVARAIGAAIGSEARDRHLTHIAVARDGRLSGPLMLNALTEGLASSGLSVVSVGEVPTPVLYFAATTATGGSGVMVTGSHNPPDYNGFKIMLGGETLSGTQIAALYERLMANRLTRGRGNITTADVREEYLARITSDVHLERPLRVAVDCGNGVAGGLAPMLFERLGCTVTPLFCDIDGRFPNHHPDPSQPANLADLIDRMRGGDIDVGLAFDGDGDRLGVVTPDGHVIWPDRQMILFARDVLSRHPGAEIIYDVKCSRTLPRAIEEAGGRATMWKTGHSFIKRRLKESEALLAGEMSGHLFFKERWYGFDDGLYAGARLLELLARDPRPSRVVLSDLPDSVNTPEIQIPITDGDPHGVVERLVQAADFPEARVATIDGLRVDFPDGFGLVRASNTTPVLVLRFEADDAAGLVRIQDRFRPLLAHALPGFTLPF